MNKRSGCVACETVGVETVEHHTDYYEDTTVPVCHSCHQRIHGNENHLLYPVGEPDRTCISVSDELADELYRRKNRGDSYEEVIWRLIEEADDE